ncbi:MAG: peptidoglycan DD-metalloendopeptidase family protein [Firmicutes bacterium]|nr:peptidoglycan DD-metalloendopeptidase family protein [Bacillota bacterium]
MLKYIKRPVCLIIALSLIVTGLVLTGSASDSYTDDSTVQKYQSQISSLESKIASAKSAISELSDTLEDLTAKKDYYDELALTYSEIIEVNESKAEALEAEIAECEAEIAELETLCEELSAQIRERIRISYENGQATYIELLLDAESFSDFLIGLDYTTNILQYDSMKMLEYEETRETLAATQAELETASASLAETISANEVYVAEAEAMSLEMEALISEALADAEKQQELLDSYENQLDAASDAMSSYIEDLIAKQGITESKVSGDYIWPLPTQYTTITSYFGVRADPFTGASSNHGALDIHTPKGTSVYASNAGTVIKAEYYGSYGNCVIIDHGGGIYTLYAHASSLAVSEGDTVSQGQVIAYVGMTGRATGYHLHFEVREGSTRVDPLGYVSVP